MITIVNLTPHVVVVKHFGDDDIVLDATGQVARIREVVQPLPDIASTLGAVPHHLVGYADKIDGLPDPVPDVLYVVSRVTAAAAQHRTDLVFPQGELRDESGQIIGCQSLGHFDHGAAEDDEVADA